MGGKLLILAAEEYRTASTTRPSRRITVRSKYVSSSEGNRVTVQGNLATLGLTAIDAATGETANRPAKRWYEMPEINKFTATPYQGSNSVQRVYDDFDAQNKLFNEAKITKQKPEDFDVRQFGKLKEAREQLTKLSKASKAIMNNENISGEQKREQLDRFNVLKANIARRVYGYDRVK